MMCWTVQILVCGAFLFLTGRAGAQSATSQDKRYFPLSQVSPTLRPYVAAYGDRLQKPGAERIRMVGTIQEGPDGVSQPTAVQLTFQLPSQVRIDQGTKVVVYDGKNAPQRLPVVAKELDTLETLIEDSLEGLLRMKSNRGSTRHLGAGIRDESVRNAAVYVDMIHVIYPAAFRGGSPQAKTFYFDSATKLLSRVEYQARPGVRLRVAFKDWRLVQGTRIPFVVEKWENDVVAMRIVLSEAEVTESSDDQPFRGQ